MTGEKASREQIIDLLHSLPEEEYALYRLGLCLMQSFRAATIGNTAADLAYVEETLRRVYDATSPEGREQFRRWLRPNGPLRLWSE